MPSLQDQLLKAGVVDQKKAKQLNKEKRKAAKQSKAKGQPQVDETKAAAAKALAEKSERDREMNRQRQAEVEKKAIQAQITQLINTNKLDRKGGDLAYQFVDGKKIKKLYVTSKLQDQLTKGQIAIVKQGDQYELVPARIAEKIQQRDEARVLVLHEKGNSETVDEDDPYADYPIPDDLMW